MTSTRRATEAWEALFRAQVSMVRRLAADDIWDPISMREYDVLFTLSRCPNESLRLHELNREILLSQPSLSRMVDRLVCKGLVSRDHALVDRRGTLVALTDAGRAMQRTIGRRYAASIRKHLGTTLTEAEMLTLQRLCDKVRLAQTDNRTLDPDREVAATS